VAFATARNLVLSIPADNAAPDGPAAPGPVGPQPLAPWEHPVRGAIIPTEVWETASGLDILRRQLSGELPWSPIAEFFGSTIVEVAEGAVSLRAPLTPWCAGPLGTLYGGPRRFTPTWRPSSPRCRPFQRAPPSGPRHEGPVRAPASGRRARRRGARHHSAPRLSRRGEFRPPALADPGVSLSSHRALVIQPSAAPSPSGRTGRVPVRRSPPGTGPSAWDDRAAVCTSAWPSASGTG
jgi:hypothetical protein